MRFSGRSIAGHCKLLCTDATEHGAGWMGNDGHLETYDTHVACIFRRHALRFQRVCSFLIHLSSISLSIYLHVYALYYTPARTSGSLSHNLGS